MHQPDGSSQNAKRSAKIRQDQERSKDIQGLLRIFDFEKKDRQRSIVEFSLRLFFRVADLLFERESFNMAGFLDGNTYNDMI